MRVERSRRRLIVSVLPIAVLVLLAAVTVLPRITPGPRRAASPVTETRSLDRRRDHDIRYTNEYLYDSAYETCDALGPAQVARKLGVPTTRPVRVARAFADENYAPAFRAGPYQGCLDALVSHHRDERLQ